MIAAATSPNYRIDALQYSAWDEAIFQQMRQAKLDAVHVTIAYHEDFKECVQNMIAWQKLFDAYPQLIFQGFSGADVERANTEGRTAIFFGTQTPSPIEADIGLVKILHSLGLRFMQLTYNNQSLLAAGCYEINDSGISRMGREVIKEMNRTGLVIDMSHSGEKSTLQAIKISQRPIAITHANAASWSSGVRNKSDELLRALGKSGGMLGFSLYPHHLKGKGDCDINDFCDMIKSVVDLMGIDHVGIGSDLCLNQPDSVVEWMRNGRWTRTKDYGEGSAAAAGFPAQPDWFQDSTGFDNIERALTDNGFSAEEVAKIMGGNWYRFFCDSFSAVGAGGSV